MKSVFSLLYGGVRSFCIRSPFAISILFSGVVSCIRGLLTKARFYANEAGSRGI